MEYREELKYIIKDSDVEILKSRLDTIMQLDKNVMTNKSYNIRSIYFDNYDNSYFYDTEDGVNERLKIRIRIYNTSSSLIKLEIKYKNNGLAKKECCNIDEELCKKIIRGEKITLKDCRHNKVLNRLYIEENMNLLKPKIIVEYDRIAYINPIGNVRITLDTNIRTSKYINKFFDDNVYSIPILDKGMHILEVKYDELLPSYVSSTIELNTLEQTAFSKYYLSRLRLREEVL